MAHMQLKKIGTINIHQPKFDRLFPNPESPRFEALSDITLANSLSVQPARTLVGFTGYPDPKLIKLGDLQERLSTSVGEFFGKFLK